MVAALVLAAAVPLHVTVSWETAEVRAGDEVAARVLCTTERGVDESLLTDAQRAQRDDVLRRVDSSWEGESRRGRMRLVLALAKADGAVPSAGVHHNGCRFLFPDQTVVRADFVLSSPTGSEAVVVEDLESGQYLAVEKLGKPSDLPELLHLFIGGTSFVGPGHEKLDAAKREELQQRIREVSEREAAKTRAIAEVNGQRDLLAEGATDDEIGAALAAMWCNLDGEPRTRTERVLGILAFIRTAIDKEPPDMEALTSGALLPATALRFKGVPAIQAPAGTRVVRTSKRTDGMIQLEPPPEDVAKAFYGRRGWWTLDFSASFPSQVERLLRGDRP
ncbi:MAG TPA: hypothetical protein VMT19_04005 [Thermoanaerobaculaceae bacterium]|nr:hypothetical protein [Thermoanaerobaculaceae bacterium]